jgi:hypothetical protein
LAAKIRKTAKVRETPGLTVEVTYSELMQGLLRDPGLRRIVV